MVEKKVQLTPGCTVMTRSLVHAYLIPHFFSCHSKVLTWVQMMLAQRTTSTTQCPSPVMYALRRQNSGQKE